MHPTPPISEFSLVRPVEPDASQYDLASLKEPHWYPLAYLLSKPLVLARQDRGISGLLSNRCRNNVAMGQRIGAL